MVVVAGVLVVRVVAGPALVVGALVVDPVVAVVAVALEPCCRRRCCRRPCRRRPCRRGPRCRRTRTICPVRAEVAVLVLAVPSSLGLYSSFGWSRSDPSSWLCRSSATSKCASP